MEAEVIEIKCWIDGTGDSYAYAKGHHDEAEFRKAAAKEQGIDPEDMDDVQHGWLRSVPANRSCDEFDTRFLKAEPHTRGAWPVTIEGWHEDLTDGN